MIPNQPAQKPQLLKLIESYPGLRRENLGRGGLSMYQIEDSFRFGEEQVCFTHWVSNHIGQRPKARSARGESPLQLLDIGSGSGILTLLLSQLIPGSTGMALEVMDRPFALLQANLYTNALDQRFQAVQGDVRAWVRQGVPEEHRRKRFNLIVLNPPYFLSGRGPERREENAGDLERMVAREESLASLEEFLSLASSLLAPGGKVFVLHRPERLTDIILDAQRCKLQATALRPVLPRFGQKASAIFVLLEKNIQKQFIFEKDLVLRREDGSYTLEVQGFYTEEA